MTGYGQLANTGAFTFALGGTIIQQTWLLALAAGLVLTGTVLVRMGFRRNKTPYEV